MYKLTVVLVSALLCVAAVNAFTAQGDFDECSCNTKGTEILKVDQCVKITCDEDDGSFANLVGCGVISIQLTEEQIEQGCEVKEKEVGPLVRYPECCEKFVECPPTEAPPTYNGSNVFELFKKYLQSHRQ